ncbi:hypothetical protein AC578_1050 [Pseudocercospora eumusae]|uniref:Uncharacterized protein n=1 Tax=Pseudocercospora eumusae TaxID=321146 RepID=A0A139HTD9_9PEZI|nr:hypothetical protein AC578_1050 [Pseudocercospora eumusae]
MVFQWYPWCYRGAVDVFNDDDIANIPSLLLQSDPYRQRELTGMQEYMGWASPYSVWNPSTNQQFAMAPNTAWSEDAIPQQRWGTGYNQPANLYGGDFGLAFGRDTTWRVPQHLAEDEIFNDTYIGPWV